MNLIGKTTNFFVTNGRLSLLIALGLSGWGIFSFLVTPKQYNPRIVAPAFQIYTNYPGKEREEILEQVTKPLENLIADIPEVEDVYSVTRGGGFSVLTVNFYVGEDSEKAKITLADRIRSRMDTAPLGITAPLISSVDPDDVSILTISINSQKLDAVEIRRFAFLLKDRLSTTEGATNIEIYGGRKKELYVELNPEKMSQKSIGIEQILNSISRQNLYVPSGFIKSDDKYIPIEVQGKIKSAEDLENLNVVIADFGSIKMKDVSRVSETIAEIDEYVHHSIKKENRIETVEDAVLMSIAKNKNSNISTVSENIENRLNELKKSGFIPPEITTEIIVNEGRVAKTEIDGLITNLFQAVIIVLFVLVLFLNLRAALLVAVSIPLTLLTVFGIGNLFGQNINRITLFALILSLGLLVDNATVVIENIVTKMGLKKENESKASVIISAVEDVGMGLFMSTVTTVLAFIPMAYVTGMMGPYMGPIPFFLPVALIVSLFLSYSINPWMAHLFLKETEISNKRSYFLLEKTKSFFVKIFDLYKFILHKVITDKKARIITMSIILGVIVLSASLPAFAFVKFRMLPKADREQFFVFIDLKDGTPLAETYRITREIEKELLKEENVLMTQSFTGRPPIIDFNGLFRGVYFRRESNQSSIRVGIKKPENRKNTSEEFVLNLRESMKAKSEKIAGENEIIIKLAEDPPGPPVLSTLLIRVQGENETLINEIALDLREKINPIEEVRDTDTSVLDETETMQIEINHDRASRSRIGVDTIASAVRTLYSGNISGIYHSGNGIEQELIMVKMNREKRKDSKYLQKLFIFNDLGIKVPLSELVKINWIKTKNPILRENRKMTAYVYGEMANRSVTYAGIDLLKILWDYSPPKEKFNVIEKSLFGATIKSEKGERVEITIGGEWELTLEVFKDLGTAMGIAILLIYCVLVAQFGSFREPLIILSTIPLSLAGVLPGFMILYHLIGLYFTATSMIGVIALAGIAVNNSIILLEYLNALKLEGRTMEDALLEAGIARFRPIMLTTVTTMLGSLTIISDPVWAGLAYALVLGLGVSSILTLFTFPALYTILKGNDWLKR